MYILMTSMISIIIWKIKGMKDILNNLEYFLQSSDILNPYEWAANFTIYEKKE